MDINFTLILSAVLSMLFAYVPGFKDWFDPLEPTKKRLIMAGLLLLVTIGAFVYGCADRLDGFVCGQDTAWEFAKLYILSIMANQTAHDLLGKFRENAS